MNTLSWLTCQNTISRQKSYYTLFDLPQPAPAKKSLDSAQPAATRRLQVGPRITSSGALETLEITLHHVITSHTQVVTNPGSRRCPSGNPKHRRTSRSPACWCSRHGDHTVPDPLPHTRQHLLGSREEESTLWGDQCACQLEHCGRFEKQTEDGKASLVFEKLHRWCEFFASSEPKLFCVVFVFL